MDTVWPHSKMDASVSRGSESLFSAFTDTVAPDGSLEHRSER